MLKEMTMLAIKNEIFFAWHLCGNVPEYVAAHFTYLKKNIIRAFPSCAVYVHASRFKS